MFKGFNRHAILKARYAAEIRGWQWDEIKADALSNAEYDPGAQARSHIAQWIQRHGGGGYAAEKPQVFFDSLTSIGKGQQ